MAGRESQHIPPSTHISTHNRAERHAQKNANTKVGSGCLWEEGFQDIYTFFFMSLFFKFLE